MARDQGTPQRTSNNGTITIRVIRNKNGPVFERDLYEFTIPKNINERDRVGTVRADDRDPRVRDVELIPVSNSHIDLTQY